MAKHRKSSLPFSFESLREEAFAEGRNELIGSKIPTDISSINLDQTEHVSEDMLCALIVKFGITLVLPFPLESLREEAFAEGRNELIGSKIPTDISSINLDQAEHV